MGIWDSIKKKAKKVKDDTQGFAMRKMLERQAKDLPEAQRKQLLEMFEKNPDLFKKMGKEIKKKMDNGMSEQHASMAVMQKYRSELQKLQR